jgi:LacI family transcriptional regulator
MAVTLNNVAETAGVSLRVVSEVMRGRPGPCSAATRKRVLSAAREMDYRPNAAARSMANGRFGSAALVLSTDGYRSNLPPGLLAGIHDALEERGLHLSVARLPDVSLASGESLPRILLERAADGMLIDYTDHIPPRFLRLLRDHQLPAVWINCRLKQDCVYPDDEGAGAWAAGQLIARGHRRLAYLANWSAADFGEAHYSVGDRGAGAARAAGEAGVDFDMAPPFAADPLAQRDLLVRYLGRRDAPTGFVTYSGEVAQSLIAAMLQRGSWPRDGVDIVTFGTATGRVLGVPLPTAVVPDEAVGRAAVEMLMEKIARPERRLPPRAVEFL